ncbi:MAG TPA: GNAT family N-acetyltransferase [Thermoanaerobaculia bacterium]
MEPPLTLVEPLSAAQWGVARRLVEEYAAALGLDLAFQDFDDEVEHLAREYGPPGGAFLVAALAGEAVGCVGLRAHVEGVGEMKRLYVAPAGRGRGTGRALVAGIVARARALGYRRMVLDTLPSMHAARALYRSFGFREIAPYRYNPVPGTSFLALELD